MSSNLDPNLEIKSNAKNTRKNSSKIQLKPKASSEPFDGVVVKGARENNLKNINVQIPRNKITVITGLSGSGKSTLAFDTIYAEGQRRYIESLSAYAKNFMEQLKKPDVDSIYGLSPSIAIDQRTISTNPRSTVGTVTEIYDFLRLLYAKVGVPKCPVHNIPVSSQKPDQVVDEVMKMPKGTKYLILSPVVQGEKGEFLAQFQKWLKKGFTRARVDGQWVELSQAKKLHKHKRHDIEILIDKLIVEDKYIPRLKESLNLALSLSSGVVAIEVEKDKPNIYSIHQACPVCAFSFPELEPRHFSFNNPRGACETCSGMGVLGYEDADPDDDQESGWEYEVCPDCKGDRLNPKALNVYVNEKNIAELSRMSVKDLRAFFAKAKFKSRDELISNKVIQQITQRLDYMLRVGTGYLSLERQTRTLSGGEVQRIRLATQVGSSLIGVLYVLDEPSIGLHPRDHHRLLEVIKEIKDRGNTILIVEHDEDTIRFADYVIDIGPGAGVLGGHVVADGTPQDIENNPNSLTGSYLSKKRKVVSFPDKKKGSGNWLKLTQATGNNLKSVDLKIPLGTLCGITGVSGSGKSTLIIDTLYRALGMELNNASIEPMPHGKIEGLKFIDRVVQINQKPIGRTPRSAPSTYVGLFSPIRDLYTQLPESLIRGYKPGHFSFNVKGGRCEACEGGGHIKVEMHFMSDVYVKCDTCGGTRYSPEIRSIKYKDKSIADVLKMSVMEALDFFSHHSSIKRKLETLQKVGLDYLTLGQSSTTLSGGEAQRIKLSKELSKKGTGKTLYILDEPTTGLHFEDINKLIQLLHSLVDQGNTVLVIEHNLDVVRSCDYLIDMGPDGGDEGGFIIAEGTPEEIKNNAQSLTGQYI